MVKKDTKALLKHLDELKKQDIHRYEEAMAIAIALDLI